MAAERFITRYRRNLVLFCSLEPLSYLFANFVFGAYVLSFYGALLDLPSRLTGDMMSPIYASLVAWFAISTIYLIGQFAAKHWNGVVIGGASLAASFMTYEPIMKRLAVIGVPWFVSTLNLEAGTKLLVGVVFGIALLYVFLSPTIWGRYLKKSLEEPRLIVQKFLAIYPSLDRGTRSLIHEMLSEDGT